MQGLTVLPDVAELSQLHVTIEEDNVGPDQASAIGKQPIILHSVTDFAISGRSVFLESFRLPRLEKLKLGDKLDLTTDLAASLVIMLKETATTISSL
jgi:hypothetical protein